MNIGWMVISSGGGNDNWCRCVRVFRMVWLDDMMLLIRIGVWFVMVCGLGRLMCML